MAKYSSSRTEKRQDKSCWLNSRIFFILLTWMSYIKYFSDYGYLNIIFMLVKYMHDIEENLLEDIAIMQTQDEHEVKVKNRIQEDFAN